MLHTHFFDSNTFTHWNNDENLLQILNNNTKKNISPFLNNRQDFFSSENTLENKKKLFLFMYPDFTKNELYKDIKDDVLLQFCSLIDISEFSSHHVYMYINKDKILNNIINIVQFNKQISYDKSELENKLVFDTIYNNMITFYNSFYLLDGTNHIEAIKKITHNHNNIKIKFFFQYRKQKNIDLDSNIKIYLEDLYYITAEMYKKSLDIMDETIEKFFDIYKNNFDILVMIKKKHFSNLEEVSAYVKKPLNNTIILCEEKIDNVKFMLEIRNNSNFTLNFAKISYKTKIKT